MKLSRVYRYALFAVLYANSAFAGPAQRLIIQFASPLSVEQQQTLNRQIKSIIQSEITVLPHSTDQRWIITINPPLDKTDLDKANKQIGRLQHVEYVEPDQIMGVK